MTLSYRDVYASLKVTQPHISLVLESMLKLVSTDYVKRAEAETYLSECGVIFLN